MGQSDPKYKKKVEEMLETAKEILEEMKKRKFKDEKEKAEEELVLAMKLLESVDNKTITSQDLEVFKEKLEKLKMLKEDAEKKLEQVKELLDGQTKGIIEKGLEYQKTVEEIERLRDEIIKNLDVEKLFEEAKKNNEIASEEFRKNIEEKRNQLKEQIPMLERMQDKTKTDIPEAEKEVEKAKKTRRQSRRPK